VEETPFMKRALALCLGLTSVFVTADAMALEFGTPKRVTPYRSAQNFALELRFSPYLPNVDDEPGLTGKPFEKNFGDNPRLFIGLEFDWQTLRIPYVGTIGPGLGVGTVSMSRDSVTVTGRPTLDEYTLTIHPIYLAAVLRGDVFWRELGFPLVPYGKIGLGAGLWDASNASGTSVANDVSGKGISYGTTLAIGVGFPLDFFDRGASRNMDNAVGINNTYIYGEYYWLNFNGLGQDRALYVGTNTWATGLAFEF
jgi:hypothetical protein